MIVGIADRAHIFVNNNAQESKNQGVLAGRPCRDWERGQSQGSEVRLEVAALKTELVGRRRRDFPLQIDTPELGT